EQVVPLSEGPSLSPDVSKPASLTVSPDSAQVFEYKSFSLSCNTSGSQGWTVKRNSTDGKTISSCGGNWGKSTSSGCTISTAKKSDSAIYWCESPSKQRSNTVQITVYGRSDNWNQLTCFRSANRTQ
ncbi:hypothetical protein GOODEAATRI_025512, partial [Goodea atripinnis]